MFRLAPLLAILAFPLHAETLAGPIRVVDADTIDIGAPVTIRLLGIDAAEREQGCVDADAIRHACGEMASAAARHLYEGRNASCEIRDHDRYGRALALCRVEGRDMGAELVRLGIARVYRDDRTYAEEEKEARLLGRGLWAFEMIDPAAWRAERRTAEAAEARARPEAGGCGIKGNIGESGYIYHLPGMRDYDRTTIRAARGERWFCTEAEAQAAGWRRARR